ncbi:MAG: extra-cytoplasmic solute receptor family protein [Herminiimonas sp.]|jgi:tripartite-type tricarboxylate transporter receptor subunit TctC|nr:extra-cytoplasmic solute receptor family protein [Herminiimonas sp.]
MNILNRVNTFARICAGLACAASIVMAGPAAAQAAKPFPPRLVKITVGFSAGGPTDAMTRELAKGLQDIWGQSVIADNRPGAASIIAADTVARSTPDGSTLLLATDTAVVVLPFVRERLPYDPLTDLKPIAGIGSIPMILVASPGFNVKTFGEFIAAAKASPGKINYASNGIGATLHIAMERLQRAAGISLNHIPYKGGAPALVDMFAGHIPVMWETVPSTLPHIREGKLIPLAIGSTERSPLLPNVPTIAELGFPTAETGIWMGIMGPGGLPPAVTQRVQDDLGKVVNSPAWRERMQARGFVIRFETSEQFNKRIRIEYDQNKALFAALGINKE